MFAESFKTGKKVLDIIECHQYEAYFVGGCVRDLLLERSIVDIDIATSASPSEIKKIFQKVIPVGIEYGTVIVRFEHQSFEVTTFRVEDACANQGLPNHVEFIDEINQDLGRRDFTINALAMDKEGHIIDLFEGKKDLNKKKIKAVGSAHDRFTEDPLRIIRALRFASQLGFSIEKETLKQMAAMKESINSIAIERITNEFTKFFSGAYSNLGINYLINTEIYKHLPTMVEYPYIIKRLPKPLVPLLSFGEVLTVFHYLEPTIPVSRWIKDWKCSNKTKLEVTKLVQAIKHFESKGLDAWLVYQLSHTYFDGFIRIINLINPNSLVNKQELLQQQIRLTIQSKNEIAIDGKDLIQLFPDLKQGSWIGTIINTLEKKIVSNELPNKKNELKEWIRCNPPEVN